MACKVFVVTFRILETLQGLGARDAREHCCSILTLLVRRCHVHDQIKYQTTDSYLLFQKSGPVKKKSIIRSRGLAINSFPYYAVPPCRGYLHVRMCNCTSFSNTSFTSAPSSHKRRLAGFISRKWTSKFDHLATRMWLRLSRYHLTRLLQVGIRWVPRGS